MITIMVIITIMTTTITMTTITMTTITVTMITVTMIMEGMVRMPPRANGADFRGMGRGGPRDHDRSRRPPCSHAGRGARAPVAARFEMDPDRRSGRPGGLALAGAARFPVVAELPHPADRVAAGRVHAGEFPHRLFQRRNLSAVPHLR